MSWEPAVAALVGLALGAAAGAFQHLLYREPEFRRRPAGRRRLLAVASLALVNAAAWAIAFRPDHYSFGPALLSALFATVFLVVASTDFERRRIPNRLTYPAAAVALAFCWAWPDRGVGEVLLGGALAAVIAAALFGAGLLLGRGRAGLGLGDAKLILLGGLVLAWPSVFPGLLIGTILASGASLGLLLAGRRNAYFSYGPYLAAGLLVPLLWPTAF